MSSIKKLLEALITRAATCGLGEEDCEHAREYLRYNEWGLSFDHVITQLHEYDCKIDQEFYELMVQIAGKMKRPAADYDFMRASIL